MPVTDWKYASSIVNADRDGKQAWSNPEYAAASDDDRAICDVGPLTYGDWLRFSGFGFTAADVPPGSAINDVEFGLERQGEGAFASDIEDSAVYVRKSTGQTGDNRAKTGSWPTSDAEVFYDSFNADLTQADVVSSSLGIDLSAYNNHGALQREARVDCGRVRVHFTPPTQPKLRRMAQVPHMTPGPHNPSRRIA